MDLINQFCTLDPFESTEGCNYIDLIKNEEKYTGWSYITLFFLFGQFLTLISTLLDATAKLIVFYCYLELLNHANLFMAGFVLSPYTREI